MSEKPLTAAEVAAWPAERRAEFLAALSRPQVHALVWSWPFWARPDQRAPSGDWGRWLVLGGRGAGKTRTGAEWVRACASAAPGARIGLVGQTLGDVREVMIEGPSGLRAIAPRSERPIYEASRRRLVWPNGSIGYAFSAGEPDSLRGPQFHSAWCDELAAWRYATQTWDMLSLSVRLGARPRRVATTTPRPTPLLRALAQDPGVIVTRAATEANAAWLAPGFVDAMRAAYAGTCQAQLTVGDSVAFARAPLDRYRAIDGAMYERISLDGTSYPEAQLRTAAPIGQNATPADGREEPLVLDLPLLAGGLTACL